MQKPPSQSSPSSQSRADSHSAAFSSMQSPLSPMSAPHLLPSSQSASRLQPMTQTFSSAPQMLPRSQSLFFTQGVASAPQMPLLQASPLSQSLSSMHWTQKSSKQKGKLSSSQSRSLLQASPLPGGVSSSSLSSSLSSSSSSSSSTALASSSSVVVVSSSSSSPQPLEVPRAKVSTPRAASSPSLRMIALRIISLRIEPMPCLLVSLRARGGACAAFLRSAA